METVALNELLTLLAKLRAERETLRKDWEKRLAEHDVKIAAVETTVRLYTNGRGIPEVESPTVTASDLRGLKYKEALHKIAERNNGLVSVMEAKRLLIAAGIATGTPKHVGPRLYNVLRDSEEFEKVGRGAFRLLSPPPRRLQTF